MGKCRVYSLNRPKYGASGRGQVLTFGHFLFYVTCYIDSQDVQSQSLTLLIVIGCPIQDVQCQDLTLFICLFLYKR